MRAELALLHERLGKTTLYVTHDQVEAMTLASRIVIFDQGRIQQVGTPGEVFNQPANLFVAGFIGTPTMNLFKARLTHEAGRAVLRGDGFMLPAPAWLPAAVQAPEQALVVGVRPQSLQPTAQAESLPIQVDVVEYLGTESQIVGHLQVPDGQRICATVAGDAKALLHRGVRLAVDAQSLHVFDAASGRTLRPHRI